MLDEVEEEEDVVEVMASAEEEVQAAEEVEAGLLSTVRLSWSHWD